MHQSFKISTSLKDLIGRGLIINDFVAMFELVKNSFDAHARLVQIRFEEDKITITDNGKGMSRDDILNKWLFVGYSAKRDGTEDKDYRGRIPTTTQLYAGAKGVGRFSCDKLGKRLSLASRSSMQLVQKLEIDWTCYEQDARREFDQIKINITESDRFPDSECAPAGEVGTVLKIEGLRSKWKRDELLKLKRELAKLINPFAIESKAFEIEIIALGEQGKDEEEKRCALDKPDGAKPIFPVNGKVENPILEIIKQKTTSISVSIKEIEDNNYIETSLFDRGEIIYNILEANPYDKLIKSNLNAEIFFLNRGAKMVFARRMGLPSAQFGSIFLFRNGFRVYPIGHENDDFFGLARRQQQGTRRFLGNRDIIGYIQIVGTKGFDEVTSRDHGLIRTPEVEELIDCVLNKCIRRLERYVVDITWKDRLDKNVDNTSRMMLDESSARITQLVSRLADTDGVRLVEYSPNLVRMIDEKSKAFESSLKALEVLAERTGDETLLACVVKANVRTRDLQAAEVEAREAKRRAESRALAAEKVAASAQAKYGAERERNRFLVAATSLDQDTILNLHHQISMHASDVHLGVRRMMGKLRESASVSKQEWIDFLERVSFRNSQILTASRFATKEGYRHQSTKETADLVIYIRDYVETVSSLWAPRGVSIYVQSDGRSFVRTFRPIEVGILIDNLVSNAVKSQARRIEFILKVAKEPKSELSIVVADDGTGWTALPDPLGRIFDKGVTTTSGSGLGLYHVKQVVEGLGGEIEAKRKPYSKELCGGHLAMHVPL